MRWILILLLTLHALLPAQEIKLKTGGLIINAEWQPADMSKPTVLLLHGTLSHRGNELIQQLQSLFKEAGYSSLAINLSLGIDDRHGPYDCQQPHRHRHQDALDEMAIWLDWLQKKGVQKVILLGHSRGGNQVAWFAAERGHPLINKVILIAPQTWNYAQIKADYQQKYQRSIDEISQKAHFLVSNRQPNVLMHDIDFIYCPKATVSPLSWISYYENDARKDTPHLIPKIQYPVLVFIGSEDQVVADLADKLKDTDAKIVLIEGADHFFRDLYGEELFETAIEFIEQ